jgi:hypothetical protein
VVDGLYEALSCILFLVREVLASFTFGQSVVVFEFVLNLFFDRFAQVNDDVL